MPDIPQDQRYTPHSAVNQSKVIPKSMRLTAVLIDIIQLGRASKTADIWGHTSTLKTILNKYNEHVPILYAVYTCQVHKFKYSIPDTDEEITIFLKNSFLLFIYLFRLKKNLTSGWLQTYHVAKDGP